ncbi:MAG TPA: histidine phosphatase family protein [Myxococcota bacterium]|jgi:serine/threonine-protein phosphatase PGAM5
MPHALLLCLLFAGADGSGHGVHYLYVVRHGIYDRDNTAVDDRSHNGINAKGHEQARLAGVRLASLPLHIDHLVSSEFLRAKETADDIGKVLHLTPARDALLNECTPTTTTTTNAACDAARAAAWSRWFVATPARDTVDVLVSHGNVIRWTLLRALGVDTRSWPQLDSANGSLTIFAVAPDGSAHLVSYDDVGHLPVSIQTWAGSGGGYGDAR